MGSVDSLRRQVGRWGLELEERHIERLVGYARLLAEYREANVIGVRSFDIVLLDHVLDSLSCFLCEPLWEAGGIIDVGSGGGLPGLPIGIVRDDARVTLVEATGKKARFLERAVEALGLTNVETVNARAEEVGRATERRGNYEVATARALARLSPVAEYCVPLLDLGGRLISMKGRLDARELAEGKTAAEILGAEVERVIPVPSLTEVGKRARHLVVIRKTRKTPGAYPRRVGAPVKRPLGVV
jgi:16S rRNA (guanine527-N7)-methyltransferase